GSFPKAIALNSSGFGFFLGTIQQAGSYTIGVTAGSFAGSTAVTVSPGAAVKLGFLAQPVGTPTGVALPPVSVQILDLYGNLVTSDNTDFVSVFVASGPGSFTSSSMTTATVHNGVATFANLTLAKPGSYTLGALVPALYTGPISTSFNVAPLQVVPGSFS